MPPQKPPTLAEIQRLGRATLAPSISKPPTVAEQRLIKKYGSLEAAKKSKEIEKLVAEQRVLEELSRTVESTRLKLSQVSPEMYEKEFYRLPVEIRKFMIPPKEYYKTPGIDKYMDAYNMQKDLDLAKKAIKNPMFLASKLMTDRARKYYKIIKSREKKAEAIQKEIKAIKTELPPNIQEIPLAQALEKGTVDYKDIGIAAELIKKGATESQASFDRRLETLGKSISISGKDIPVQVPIRSEAELKREADIFLAKKDLAMPDVYKPVDIKDKKGFFGNIWTGFKGAYGTLPFSSISLPSEIQEKRKEKVFSLFGKDVSRTFLTPKEVIKGMEVSKGKKEEAKIQIELIKRFQEAVEEAPEDIKYYVQEQGLDLLGQRKFRGEYLTPVIKDSKIIFESSVLGETITGISKQPLTYHQYLEQSLQQKLKKEQKKVIPYTVELFGKSVVLSESPETQKIRRQIGVLRASYAAGKAAETIVIVEMIGLGMKGVIGGTKMAYHALGGGLYKGLQIGDITIKGGKLVGTLSAPAKTPILQKLAAYEAYLGITKGTVKPVFATLHSIQQAAPTVAKIGFGVVGKGVFVGGLGSLYAFGKFSQYEQLKQRFGEDIAKGMVKAEVTGELGGMAFMTGMHILQSKQIKAIKLKQDKITALQKMRQAELKLAQQKISIGRGTRTTRSIGRLGELKATEKDFLIKQMSKIQGISQREAAKVIAEQKIYVQTIKIKSNVHSFDRAIHFVKTGKSMKGLPNQFLTIKRYGLMQSMQTDKGVRTIAFEFSKSGSTPTYAGIKVSYSKGDKAITYVFQKARDLPSTVGMDLKLKQVITSKPFNLKQFSEGKVIGKVFNVDERLVKSISGKELLKAKRISIEGIFKKAFVQKELKGYEKLYQLVGKEATISKALVIRTEQPFFKKAPSGIGIAIGDEKLIQEFVIAGGDIITKAGRPLFKVDHPKFGFPGDKIGKIPGKKVFSLIGYTDDVAQKTIQLTKLSAKEVTEVATTSIFTGIVPTGKVTTQAVISTLAPTSLITGFSFGALEAIREKEKVITAPKSMDMLMTGLKVGVEEEEELKKDVGIDTSFGTSTATGLGTGVGTIQKPIVTPIQKPVVTPTVTPTITPGVGPGIITPSITPTTPEIIKPIPSIGGLFFPLEKKRVSKAQGYNVHVMKEATKESKRRYEKINPVLLNKESAKSMMARVVDKTISARGRIQKAQKQVQVIRDRIGNVVGKREIQVQVADTKDRYWQQNKHKFRNYKVVKGKRRPLAEGTYIEKRKYRLDSPGEVKKIQKERSASSFLMPTRSTNNKKKKRRKFSL